MTIARGHQRGARLARSAVAQTRADRHVSVTHSHLACQTPTCAVTRQFGEESSSHNLRLSIVYLT